MNAHRICLAPALLAAIFALPTFAATTVTFEGLADNTAVPAGALAGQGVTNITGATSWKATTSGGSVPFANMPSSSTAIEAAAGGAVLDIPGGFTGSVTVFYSANGSFNSVKVFAGAGGSGMQLGTSATFVDNRSTCNAGVNPGDPACWTLATVNFVGTGQSILLPGNGGTFYYDNLVFTPVVSASATLTFEGLADNTAVPSNAFTGQSVTNVTGATSFKATSAGGSVPFGNMPSASTAILAGNSGAIFDIPGGFTGSVTVYYAANGSFGQVKVYAATGGTGMLLGSSATFVDNISTCNSGVNPGDPACWTLATVTFVGTGQSIVLPGAAGAFYYDNLTFSPVGGVQPPTVVAPNITKGFSPSSVALNGTTHLVLTLENPNGVPMDVSVVDNLPAGLTGVSVFTQPACATTATVTATQINFAANGLAAGATCTASFTVQATMAGTITNTTNAVQGVESGQPYTGGTAMANLTVLAPPTVSKVITADTLAMGQTTSMTLTLTNPNTVALTGVSLTDLFPAGLAPSNPGGTCTPTATVMGQTLSISGVALAADPAVGHQCTITATVTATAAGSWTNTTNAPQATGPIALTGIVSNGDTVLVVAPPSLLKEFTPAMVDVTSHSTLTFTIANPNALPMTNIAFSDPLTNGLIVGGGLLSNTCGGTVTAVTLTTTISFANGSLGPNGMCQMTFDVQAMVPGTVVNTTSNITATVSGINVSGMGGTATLQVGPARDAFLVRYASNLNAGDSVVNITNTGVASSATGIPDPQNGNVCVNVYAYTPDEQLASCCSCLVTPNGLNSLSVRDDLASNPLTPVVPSSLVIKLLASVPVNGVCNPAKVTRADTTAFLLPGIEAWGTSLHATTVPGTYATTETPFLKGFVSDVELQRATTLCGFNKANGSGYGICKSCKLGGLGAAAK